VLFQPRLKDQSGASLRSALAFTGSRRFSRYRDEYTIPEEQHTGRYSQNEAEW